MSLVRLPSSSKGRGSGPAVHEKLLQAAIDDFQNILTPDQLSELRHIKSVPNADAVYIFTAQLDARSRSRKGRSIASRLHTVLQSVWEFSSIVGIFVSANPEIAALVWGSVRLTMKIAVNFTSYFESLSNLFLDLTRHCPRYSEYQALFPHSVRLQRALCKFNASLISTCKHAVEAIQRPWHKQLANAMWTSFHEEFKDDRKDIENCSHEVHEEIFLAKTETDRMEQKFHRETATGLGRVVNGLVSITQSGSENMRQWQIQHGIGQANERRRLLLNDLSSHDFLSPFREARKKRHYGTAEWILSTKQFCHWKDVVTSCTFWCSGKIGSGKTVLTASVLDDVYSHKDNTEKCITFFFIRYDDPQSLKAESILRSLLRQSLSQLRSSQDIDTALKLFDLQGSLSEQELIHLLRLCMASWATFHIFIDGLDECEWSERRYLLRILASIDSTPTITKIYLAGRGSLSTELRPMFPQLEHVAITSPLALPDITLFVKESLRKRQETGEVSVSSSSLLEEMEITLSQHADGMFLWVNFLLDEICSQKCDADIRHCLEHLPRDLEDTFDRALARMVSRKNSSIVQKVLPWICVARQNLTLGELKEAMAIEVGRPSLNNEKLVNDIDRVAFWCENFVEIDEESKTVRFSHSTIHDFIIENRADPQHASFHINLEDADCRAAEACITYLHFDVFTTTVARRVPPLPVPTPAGVVRRTIGHRKALTEPVLRLVGLDSNSKDDTTAMSVNHPWVYKQSFTASSFEERYPFLNYAATHWISHSKMFEEHNNLTWNLWRQMVLEGHPMAQVPWPKINPDSGYFDAFIWAHGARHFPLLTLLTTFVVLSISGKWILDFEKLMVKSAGSGDLEMVQFLLSTAFNFKFVLVEPEGHNALHAACAVGHLEVVDQLLQAGAPVNAMAYQGLGITALQLACKGGHLHIVRSLIKAGAEVNALAGFGRSFTALEAACDGGELAVVELLISEKPEVHDWPALNGWSTQIGEVLAAAFDLGHVGVVEFFLEAGAKISDFPEDEMGGYSYLSRAVRQDSIYLASLLLATGIDIQAAFDIAIRKGEEELARFLWDYGVSMNHNLLLDAIEQGQLETGKLLVELGADINKRETGGQTLLMNAVEADQVDKVNLLCALGADLEVQDRLGRTALFLAIASEGPLTFQLVTLGANIEAIDKNGDTPLMKAAKAGSAHAVSVLAAYGANIEAVNGGVGQTPLLRAVLNRHRHVVIELIRAGAHLDSKDALGCTPLARLVFDHDVESAVGMANLLLDSGAKVDARDDFRRTPLAWAAAYGNTDMVEFLLDKGADINRLDKDRRTPLMLAALNWKVATAKQLISHGAMITARDKNLETAVDLATASLCEPVASMLISMGGVSGSMCKTKSVPANTPDVPGFSPLYPAESSLVAAKGYRAWISNEIPTDSDYSTTFIFRDCIHKDNILKRIVFSRRPALTFRYLDGSILSLGHMGPGGSKVGGLDCTLDLNESPDAPEYIHQIYVWRTLENIIDAITVTTNHTRMSHTSLWLSGRTPSETLSAPRGFRIVGVAAEWNKKTDDLEKFSIIIAQKSQGSEG